MKEQHRENPTTMSSIINRTKPPTLTKIQAINMLILANHNNRGLKTHQNNETRLKVKPLGFLLR